MTRAKSGDSVKIHYTGTLENGQTFDSSKGREPFEFILGAGQVIPGFDDAVTGMEIGEIKTETISADRAYGAHRDDMIIKVSNQQIPDGMNPQVGNRLAMQTKDGQEVPVEVTEVTPEGLTLDANHPLAGKDLTFEIELVAIA